MLSSRDRALIAVGEIIRQSRLTAAQLEGLWSLALRDVIDRNGFRSAVDYVRKGWSPLDRATNDLAPVVTTLELEITEANLTR